MIRPTQDILHFWFYYDDATGVFTWKREPRSIGPVLGKKAGTKRGNGYIFISVRGSGQVGAHRLAWIYVHGNIPPGMEVDHINCNPSDNRICNLRLATSSQQKMNKRVQSNNRSGLKGAFYHACHKGKKWRSQIRVGSHLLFLGYFHTAEEAHVAYAKACREHFGQFARAS